MKKMTAAALAAALCLALAGCSGGAKPEETTLSESEQQAIGESLSAEIDQMAEDLTAEAELPDAAAIDLPDATGVDRTDDAETEAADADYETEANEEESAPAEAETASGDISMAVPVPFMYTGNNPYMPAVVKWMEENVATYYDTGEYYIPAPVDFYTDARDQSDILIWGDFRVFRYDLEDTNLVCQSGGSHVGLLHLRATEEDPDVYEAFEFEACSDGSDFDDDLKKICEKAPEEAGDLYARFSEAHDDGTYDEVRMAYLKMYADQVPFPITSFQDYGQDPVTIE